VAFSDDGLYQADKRMTQERLKRPADDRLATDQLVLLGNFPPGAQATAACDNDHCH
jgi:hypothetical protein